MAKQLLYTDDARKKLLLGAEKLAKAVEIGVRELNAVGLLIGSPVELVVGGDQPGRGGRVKLRPVLIR